MTTTAAGSAAIAARGHQPGGRRQPVVEESSPTQLYEAALRSAHGLLWVRHPDGRRDRLPVHTWRGEITAGDPSLLRRCAGPTLDIGCGPGRLTAALSARGVPTLGIDVAPHAVRLTRRTGAAALCRDVFDPVPAEGRWSTLLLADGNIGIGGDPDRLLTRAAELLGPAGRVLVELEPDETRRSAPHPTPPSAPPGRRLIRLEGPGGRVSSPFPWAFVGDADIHRHASAAGLGVAEIWHSRGRLFAALG